MAIVAEKEICENGKCVADVYLEVWDKEIKLALKKRLDMFISGIEKHEELEIIGESGEDKDILVIQNSSLSPTALGHQVEVDQKSIMENCTSKSKVDEFIKCILGDRPGHVLNGISRIVGYYSRTVNWNKSKIGELRDRGKGKYWTEEKGYNEV